MNRLEVESHSILIGLVGSHAYGLNTDTSDEDYRGIFIAPEEYQLGIKTIEQKDKGWDEVGILKDLDGVKDICIYELKKIIKLLKSNNPNCIELLYLNNYLLLTEEGKELINNRDLFLSKNIKNSYAGYAYSQVHRVENHRKWLLNPVSEPNPNDYGLEGKSISKSELNAFLEFLWFLIKDRIEYIGSIDRFNEFKNLLLEELDFKAVVRNDPLPEGTINYVKDISGVSDNYIQLIQSVHSYKRDRQNWINYQSWVKNRNPKRAEIEARCGYDGKHLAQCLRLLHQGIQLLREGTLTINMKDHPNYQFIKDVKMGLIPYEELKSMTDCLFDELNEAVRESILPNHPNEEVINDLCVCLIKERL